MPKQFFNIFDGLSTLAQQKFIDDNFVPETTAIALINFWEKFEPDSESFVKVYRRPGCWDAIRGFYDKLQKTDASLSLDYLSKEK